MSTKFETWLRSLGTVIAFAIISSVLGYFANSTNLTSILNPAVATTVAGLAATLLAVWDKAYSPPGTVAFGTVGKQGL